MGLKGIISNLAFPFREGRDNKKCHLISELFSFGGGWGIVRTLDAEHTRKFHKTAKTCLMRIKLATSGIGIFKERWVFRFFHVETSWWTT